ncbi:MAG: hypothetical protein FD181_2624 [Prolixibacteraceae bacterium]|nr:MAG: hypothetical protein FD181_2624 [Prolixibacteraceae bacterium]
MYLSRFKNCWLDQKITRMQLRYNVGTNNLITKLSIFVIWPFGAFLFSLKNLKSKSSFLIFFLFCVLFGYTFIAKNKSFDSYKYVEDFNYTKNYTTTNYTSEIKEYLTFDSRIKDIYVLTCNFLVSRISHNYHFLFGLFAIIFAYFYLKSFRFLVDRPEFSFSVISYILAFLFTFSNPIFNINGVRFYTAAWIAVFSLFQITINKNNRYLLLAAITPLIHISYLSVLGVILLYLLLKKYEKAWIIAYLTSFFVTNIAIENVGFLKEFAPASIQHLIWAYTEGTNLYERLSEFGNLPMYAKVLNILPNIFLNGLMIVFIYNRKKIKNNIEAFTVFMFLLVWMTFVNFTWGIPSFGARFLALSIPFIVYLILITRKQISVLTKLTYLIPIVFSYPILYWVRNMISISDPYLYLSNLVHLVIKNL